MLSLLVVHARDRACCLKNLPAAPARWLHALPPIGPPSRSHAARRPRRRPESFRPAAGRSEEHTSELQSLMRISYAVFCLKKKKKNTKKTRAHDLCQNNNNTKKIQQNRIEK